jgi:iron complex transport system substrate-binding protein
VKKVFVVFLVIVMASFLLTNCGREPRRGYGTRELVDLAGRTVILPETIENIFVDFGAGGNVLIQTLGATEKLIAIQPGYIEAFPWTRVLSPEIENVKIDMAPFASPFGRPIVRPASSNLEAILKYNPDLIITNIRDNIDIYEGLGLTVFFINITSDYESYIESMLLVGTALGETYLDVAMRYRQFYEEIKSMVSQMVIKSNKLSVYYLDGRFEHPFTTIGTGEIQEYWIYFAGGLLATTDLFTGRNVEITAEQFLMIDPDAIMIGGINQRNALEALFNHRALSQSSAVTNGRVFLTPTGLFSWCRHGPEAVLQILWAAQVLYPELFLDVDTIEIFRDFYREFFRIELSDDYLQDILNGRDPGGR